jgi:hypothetical protein
LLLLAVVAVVFTVEVAALAGIAAAYQASPLVAVLQQRPQYF